MANLQAAAPPLDFIFDARVTVGPPQDLGVFNKGRRRVVPITGGEFSGPHLRGVVFCRAPTGSFFAATALRSLRRATHYAPTTAHRSLCTITRCATVRPR